MRVCPLFGPSWWYNYRSASAFPRYPFFSIGIFNIFRLFTQIPRSTPHVYLFLCLGSPNIYDDFKCFSFSVSVSKLYRRFSMSLSFFASKIDPEPGTFHLPLRWYISSLSERLLSSLPISSIYKLFAQNTVIDIHVLLFPCLQSHSKEASMFNLPLRGCISSRYECLLSYLGLESQLYIQIWSRETSFLSLSLPRALKFLESANFKCFSHFGPLSQNISVGIQRLSLSLPPKWPHNPWMFDLPLRGCILSRCWRPLSPLRLQYLNCSFKRYQEPSMELFSSASEFKSTHRKAHGSLYLSLCLKIYSQKCLSLYFLCF